LPAAFNLRRWFQRRALRVASRSLTIREGKAFIGLDESRMNDRVELYLAHALKR
jgi:hypothetical protein